MQAKSYRTEQLAESVYMYINTHDARRGPERDRPHTCSRASRKGAATQSLG